MVLAIVTFVLMLRRYAPSAHRGGVRAVRGRAALVLAAGRSRWCAATPDRPPAPCNELVGSHEHATARLRAPGAGNPAGEDLGCPSEPHALTTPERAGVHPLRLQDDSVSSLRWRFRQTSPTFGAIVENRGARDDGPTFETVDTAATPAAMHHGRFGSTPSGRRSPRDVRLRSGHRPRRTRGLLPRIDTPPRQPLKTI
jgi:hypothetical protein